MDSYKSNLSALISKIKVLSDKICLEQNDVSQMEIDVLKDKLRQVYDLLLDFPIIMETQITETFSNNEQLFVKEDEEKVNDEEKVKEKSEEAEHIVKNTPSVLKYLHENIMTDAEKEISHYPSDLFGDGQQTIADKFSENETLNDKVYETIMTDLRTNIGVNEKFLFINELFFGNMKAYTDFIQELNNSNTFEMAIEIILKYKAERDWKETSLAYTTLNSIMEKRFKRARIII
ncbi:MAG: hypothetical protein LBR28_00470 [Bacteroidales bacterium]|jgi:hypothetical protein|nr:hypothetical protein [Bacteroidales bacterium]